MSINIVATFDKSRAKPRPLEVNDYFEAKGHFLIVQKITASIDKSPYFKVIQRRIYSKETNSYYHPSFSQTQNKLANIDNYGKSLEQNPFRITNISKPTAVAGTPYNSIYTAIEHIDRTKSLKEPSVIQFSLDDIIVMPQRLFLTRAPVIARIESFDHAK